MRRAPLFLALLAISGSALASDLKSTVKSIDDKVKAAFLKNDMKAFEAATRPNVTSDFKYTEMGKTQTYDEMLAEMKPSFATFSKITKATVKSNVKQHGKTGTSNTHHHITAISMGPDKKKHTIVMDGNSVDTWIQDGKAWKMSQMVWKNQKMTMDGKPFNPQEMMPPKSK